MADWKSRAVPVQEQSASDWKARAVPIQEIEQVAPETTLGSKVKSGLIGASQGAALGYAPEIYASMKANPVISGDTPTEIQSNIAESQPNFNQDEARKTYAGSKEYAQKELEAAQAANPKSFFGGELLGGIATTPGIGSGLKSVGVLAPEARGMLKGAYEASKMGGAIGLMSKPQGDDIINPSERVKNAVKGGLIAAPFGALGGISTPKELEEKAARRAFKAFDPKLKDVNKNLKNIQQLGKTALDVGLIGKQFKTYEELADATKESLELTGSKLDNWIDRISDAASKKAGVSAEGLMVPGSKIAQAKVGVDKVKIIETLRQELADIGNVPGASSKAKRISSVIDEFENGHPDIINIKDANKLKVKLGKEINWDRPFGSDIPPNELAQRAIYTSLKQGVEDAAEALSETLGKGSKEAYIADKVKYGNLKTLHNIANKSAGRDFSNRFLSLSDYQSGQTGGIIGAMMGLGSAASPGVAAAKIAGGAALGALGNKFARTLGDQPMAGLLYKASKSPTVKAASGLLNSTGAISPGITYPALQQMNEGNGN
jgi:hypothetical protein